MRAVQTPVRLAERSRPFTGKVAATVSMAPANRAPLPDCVPKLPLRHRTARRQDGRPDGTCGTVVGGFDPGDIQIRPEGRPQGVDAFAHPSHPEVSRPGALGQEFAEPGLHLACPALVGPQGRPVLHEGRPIGEVGPVEAPGPHPNLGAVATTDDETLDITDEVCPAHQRQLRRMQPVGVCVAVAGVHAAGERRGQLPDHLATETG